MRQCAFAWVYSFGFNMCVSLSLLNSRRDLPHCLSLKSLAEEVLNCPLDKSPHVRCSNWEAEELTQDQVCLPLQPSVLGEKATFLVEKRHYNRKIQAFFKVLPQNLMCGCGLKLDSRLCLAFCIFLLFHEDNFLLFWDS